MALENDVLRKISPSDEERRAIDRKVGLLLERVKSEADKEDLGLEVLMVGSVAKDTFLRDPDLDVFILFPESVSRERLESIGLALGKDTPSIPISTACGKPWRSIWCPVIGSWTRPG